MSVTALFATTGATNAGLYPVQGLANTWPRRAVPPLIGRTVGGLLPVGLLIASVVIIVMVVGFDLSAIASIGSAVALMIFAFVTAAHLRVFRETGARPWVLVLALLLIVVTLLTFIFTTLIHEPASARDPRGHPRGEHRPRPRLDQNA